MKSKPGLKTHLILSYSLTPEIFGSSMITQFKSRLKDFVNFLFVLPKRENVDLVLKRFLAIYNFFILIHKKFQSLYHSNLFIPLI